jgi:hypothetical protein
MHALYTVRNTYTATCTAGLDERVGLGAPSYPSGVGFERRGSLAAAIPAPGIGLWPVPRPLIGAVPAPGIGIGICLALSLLLFLRLPSKYLGPLPRVQVERCRVMPARVAASSVIGTLVSLHTTIYTAPKIGLGCFYSAFMTDLHYDIIMKASTASL